jgi:hypothetical protein
MYKVIEKHYVNNRETQCHYKQHLSLLNALLIRDKRLEELEFDSTNWYDSLFKGNLSINVDVFEEPTEEQVLYTIREYDYYDGSWMVAKYGPSKEKLFLALLCQE